MSATANTNAAEHTPRKLVNILKERDATTNQSGHYWGVKEFTIRDADPMKFERFYSRIQSVVISAREVARYVAASPGGREMGENGWALATPEGESLAISFGFTSHAAAFPYAIRFMIEKNYENNPGFQDGDVFACTDGLTGGAPHPADAYTYVSIMHEGEVVGWAAGINHIMEVGAPQAGSWALFAVDTFMDGFVCPPMKTGEKLQQFAWWDELWKRRTRTAAMNILDDKMRLAGCAIILKGVHEIIDEFGADYYRLACREIIEETRRVVKNNIKNWLVPGRYEGAGFRPCCYKGLQTIWAHADKDMLLHMHQTVEFDENFRLVADHMGTSRWDFNAFNGFPGGADVSLLIGMATALAHNTKFSSGLSLMLEGKYPYGSMLNPDSPNASHTNSWAQMAMVATLSCSALHRGHFMRGYLEEATAMGTVFDAVQGEGVMDDGTPYGYTNFELLGSAAQGGFPFKDGEPANWFLASQLCNMGNSEEFEYLIPPYFHLGRKLEPGYCGHGKYRAGIGITAVHWAQGTGQRFATSRAGNTCAAVTHMVSGMNGGYPCPGGMTVITRNADIDKIIAEQGDTPTTLNECIDFVEQGKLKADEQSMWKFDVPELEIQENDLWAHSAASSGGWGDPLERPAELVLEDAANGQVPPEFSKVLYGVVTEQDDNGKWSINEAETQTRRSEIIEQRKADSVPAEQFWQEERALLVNRQLIDPVLNMYRSSTSFDEYGKFFDRFWQLPEEFKL